MKAVLFLLVFTAFGSAGQQLINERTTEVIYLFSYKSPGSHAMVNSVSAFEMVHANNRMPGNVYRVPYVGNNDDALYYAGITYFMLRLHYDDSDELAKQEMVAYEIFKQLDVQSKEQLFAVLKMHIFKSLDNVQMNSLYQDANVMVKQSRILQEEIKCPTLPCVRVSSHEDYRYVTLGSSDASIKTFWENVLLTISTFV